MALATFDCAESEKPFFLPKMPFFGGVETLGRALSSESFQVIPIFSNAKPVPVVVYVGFISNLDSRIILSKSRKTTGATSGEGNSVRNASEQLTQFSRLDGCVAYQILRLCQARAHNTASFQMCSMGIYGVLFFRRAILKASGLVLCQSLLEGYSFLSLIRASSVVNRQWTVVPC